VKQDCGPWLSEVNEELPSVVVAAKDEHGADTATVEVRVDGELLAERLDGMPIDVDPGEHLFRFALPSGTALEKRVLVRAGDKGRELSVSFAPESAVRPPPLPRRQAGESSAGLGSHPRLTLPAIVLGSVGALALGSWGYFGLSGRSRQTQLEGSCQPNCPPSEIDDVRHRYLAADISLGVAVISLGVATFLTLSAPSPAVTAAAER
jgi:hypothetical protein